MREKMLASLLLVLIHCIAHVKGQTKDEGMAAIFKSNNKLLQCKTTKNETCVFPFKYQGNTYNDCIKPENGKSWCATQNKPDGSVLKWGFCDPICERNEIDKLKDGDLFEGDIVMSPTLRNRLNKMIKNESDGNSPFDVSTQARHKWPNAIVPYVFDRGFSSRFRGLVARAIAEFKKYTCVKFVPKTRAHRYYVHFWHGSGCSSMIGRENPGQRISLAHSCYPLGTVIHEMMHAIGFYHEQSRRDRDKYIYINWNNIHPRMKFNFKMYRQGEATTYGQPYDKSSVMHYPNNAFAINYNIPVITDRQNPRRQLGQRNGFSQIDVKQINAHYCGGKTGGGGGTKPNPSGGCRDTDNRCAGWIQQDRSYCSNNQFVKTNCKKSCGKCGGTGGGGGSSSCVDTNTNCASWARRGECTKNTWMKKGCCKSCKNIGGGGGSSNCKDDNANCARWARSNQCRINPAYMLRSCKKSCNRCFDVLSFP